MSNSLQQTSLPFDTKVLYDARFFESHVGSKILTDPKTAVIELLANAWDAGATEVQIHWPDFAESSKGEIIISDNGQGMTNEEFQSRWRTLNYDRSKTQGNTVLLSLKTETPPVERPVFGQNGIGRWASFCFGDVYYVDTKKNGLRNRYEVTLESSKMFQIHQEINDEVTESSGTLIQVAITRTGFLPVDNIRNEIGMRFLTNPNFMVKVNEKAVLFDDIDDAHKEIIDLDIDGEHHVKLFIIDTQSTDRTAKQHGIAWHVQGRLVGECSWNGLGDQTNSIIDRRKIAARRFTFIVNADYLGQEKAIKKDWSGFREDNELYKKTAKRVHDEVEKYFLNVSEDDRKRILNSAQQQNHNELKVMGPLDREIWTDFVNDAQENCPAIREVDIIKLSEIIANLSLAKSGYSLLHQLGQYGPDQLDDLNKLLADWTLDMAKVVLDEIDMRLKVVDELELRLHDKNTREVQDMQPLFKKGLWIFGPEYETIEYTSNPSMVNVLQQLHGKKDLTASKDRPDFVVLPDGTTGLYSYPRYDENDNGENGVDKLMIIELKKPGVKIGETQKSQCWRYVKQLTEKGLIQEKFTSVRCFVLGSEIANQEGEETIYKDGTVKITPILFDSVINRAKSRMLKLHERVKEAPFLREHRQEIDLFLKPIVDNSDLFESADK